MEFTSRVLGDGEFATQEEAEEEAEAPMAEGDFGTWEPNYISEGNGNGYWIVEIADEGSVI